MIKVGRSQYGMFSRDRKAAQLFKLPRYLRDLSLLRARFTDTETHCFNQLDTTNDTTWVACQNRGSWFASAPSNPQNFDTMRAATSSRLGVDPNTGFPDSDLYFVMASQAWSGRFTNQGTAPADVTYWICYPRRDVSKATSFRTPLSYGSTTSPNRPDLLHDGWVDYAAETGAGGVWDQTVDGTVTNISGAAAGSAIQDQTPYNAKNWCSLFKMSRPRRFILGLGETKVIKLTDFRSKTVASKKYGLSDGDGISDNFYYLRDNGPILLFRVTGAPGHDELQVDSTMNDQDLQPQSMLYSVTCMVQKHYDALIPTVYDSSPMKLRLGGTGSGGTWTGGTGFTGTTPFNTVALAANEAKLETRLPGAPTEVAFNT